MANRFPLAAAFSLCLAFFCAAPGSLASRFTTVVIDAGHGGFDRGGVPGQRVAEKTVALDVAQRLERALDRQGYHTIMTRDQDVFVPLPQRVAIANSYRNAIFVCIHFNAASRRGANGIETYYYSSESAPLAASIHRNLVARTPTENRGVRRRGYYVLRKTRIPAVLVECGFLTNPLEAELAQTAGYRQKLANQIAAGIRGQPVLAERRSSSGTYASVAAASEPGLYHVDASGTSYLASAETGRSKKKSSTKKSSSKKTSSKRGKKRSSKKSSHTSSTKESANKGAKKKRASKDEKKRDSTETNE